MLRIIFSSLLITGFACSALSACGSQHPSASKPQALAIEDPLGGTRYIFVSRVDGKLWGIVCPGPVEIYVGKSNDEIMHCGYTQAFGPVAVEDFVRAMPGDIDRYALEQDLRSRFIVPVATSRDRYYEAWETLKRLASGAQATGPINGCQASECSHLPVVFTVDVHSQDAALFIYATQAQGHIGKFEVDGNEASRLLYLNVQQKALINLFCGNTTIYLSRELRDQVIVNSEGGVVRYFYL